MSKRFGRNQKRKLQQKMIDQQKEFDRGKSVMQSEVVRLQNTLLGMGRQIDELVKVTFAPRVQISRNPVRPREIGVGLDVNIGGLMIERRLDAAFDYRALLMGVETKESLILQVAKQLVSSL